MAKAREMTEELWLKSRDLKRLFARLGKPTVLVQDPAVRRKYRLFGVAALTHSWRGLDIPPAICHCVAVAERFADGNATANELLSARAAVQHDRKLAKFSLAACCVTHDDALFAGYDAAEHGYVQTHGRHDLDAETANALSQADLFRDIFGNPFRPVAFGPGWRTSTTIALAESMYASRDFGAMPVLADALEEADCDHPDVLAHCRGPGLYVRGCWVVDLLLGKG